MTKKMIYKAYHGIYARERAVRYADSIRQCGYPCRVSIIHDGYAVIGNR